MIATEEAASSPGARSGEGLPEIPPPRRPARGQSLGSDSPLGQGCRRRDTIVELNNQAKTTNLHAFSEPTAVRELATPDTSARAASNGSGSRRRRDLPPLVLRCRPTPTRYGYDVHRPVGTGFRPFGSGGFAGRPGVGFGPVLPAGRRQITLDRAMGAAVE